MLARVGWGRERESNPVARRIAELSIARDPDMPAPAYVDFSSRPVGDRPVYVERWVEILGFLGLTAVTGVEDGEKALVHAYAALWDGGYDERFVATGNAIISIVAPARGLGDVYEIIPKVMFRGARLEGESIVLALDYAPFGSEILSDVGTSEKGRREFTTSKTITVPADSVVVLTAKGEGARTSALKLLQLTAQSPDNVLEAIETTLVEGAQEVNALVGDTAEAAGKVVVETLDSAKTAAIQKFLQLAANIENEDHREFAFRTIYALDGLASAILLGVSAVVGVVGGAVKGVVGIATGFASLAGAAIGVIEDLATWIIHGDFEELRARGEDIILAVEELAPAVSAAFNAWVEDFEAADPNEKARLIGDAVGQILAVVAEILVGTKTGTISELRQQAAEKLDRIRRAAKDVGERAAARTVTAGKEALAKFDDFGGKLLSGEQTEVERRILKMLGIEPGGGPGGPPMAPATASLDGGRGGRMPDGRSDDNALLNKAEQERGSGKAKKRGDHLFAHGLSKMQGELRAKLESVLLSDDVKDRVIKASKTLDEIFERPEFSKTVDKGATSADGDHQAQAFGEASREFREAREQFFDSAENAVTASPEARVATLDELKRDAQAMNESWDKLIDSAEDVEATELINDMHTVEAGRQSLEEAREEMLSMSNDIIKMIEGENVGDNGRKYD